MLQWRRALGCGALSWLIPFVISFAIFPLKKANAPLFQNLMALVVLLTAAVLMRWYFRDRAPAIGEAVGAGTLWLAINLILDYPMFAFGPMRMTAGQYYSEIGLAYLMFPVFAFGAARLAARANV